MSPTAMRQRPSPCCTAMHTRPSWNVCRRRSIASARCSENRAAVAIDRPPIASRIWRTLSEIMVGLTALMFCSSSALFSNAGCSASGSPERRGAASRLPGLCGETPQFTQVDEIGDMAQPSAFSRERPARQQLERQRDADWAIRELLARMTPAAAGLWKPLRM